jgi:hypothetical protein
MSAYVFTGNNPVMLVDPDGRKFVTPSDIETANRAKTLANNKIKEYKKNNASYQKSIDKIGLKSSWSSEKKAMKIDEYKALIKTNEEHIENLEGVISDINEMGKSETNFSFQENSNAPVNNLYVTSEGTVIIPYGNDANLIHEIVHGGQVASGRIEVKLGSSVLEFNKLILTPINSEVEAYRAQYSFDSNSMPKTDNGKFDSLKSITPNSIRGIYYETTNMLGKQIKEYPYNYDAFNEY